MAPLPAGAQPRQRRQPAAITGQRLTRSVGGGESGGAGQGGSDRPSLARTSPSRTFPTWQCPAARVPLPASSPPAAMLGAASPPYRAPPPQRAAGPPHSPATLLKLGFGEERSAVPQAQSGRREGLRAAPAERTFHGGRAAHAAARLAPGEVAPAAPDLGTARRPPVAPRARGCRSSHASAGARPSLSLIKTSFTSIFLKAVVWVFPARLCRLDWPVRSTCKSCKNKRWQSSRF